jgi:hypothetical protein
VEEVAEEQHVEIPDQTEALEPDEVNTLFLTNSPSPIYCIYLEIYIFKTQESVGPDGMEGYGNVTAAL